MEIRGRLDSTLPSQEAYTPPANPQELEERVRVFIAVRAQLLGHCPRFTEIELELGAMEAFDKRDDVSRPEVLKQALRTTGAAMRVAPAIGDFHETRNRSLLENGMGLGEYTYLYLAAYHRQLANSEPRVLFDNPVPNPRVRADLLAMLRRQAAVIATASGEDSPAHAQLTAEIDALEGDSDRLPWADGLPPDLAAALAPRRQALDRAFCAPTAPIELTVNRRRAIAIETY
jgi:hypothetical protein